MTAKRILCIALIMGAIFMPNFSLRKMSVACTSERKIILIEDGNAYAVYGDATVGETVLAFCKGSGNNMQILNYWK